MIGAVLIENLSDVAMMAKKVRAPKAIILVNSE